MKMMIGIGNPSKGKSDDSCSEMEIEAAFETLLRAKEIESNEKLLHEVRKYAKKKKKAISSIADLRSRLQESDELDED